MEHTRAQERRRALLRLLRRAGVVTGVVLIVVAVLWFSSISVSVQVSSGVTQELVNGQQNSSSLLPPLGTFAAGLTLLAACLR